MTAGFLATLAGLGFVGALLSGLVGVGGAVVAIPLLYYVPPRLGVGVLGIKEVSGVTMAQVLAGAVVGAVVHGVRGGMHRPLAVIAGTSMACASLAGAVVSRHVSDRLMLAVFGMMAALALILMFLPAPPDTLGFGSSTTVEFDRRAAVAYPAAIGFVSGLVGAGGAFLLMPVLMGVMRIPLRLSIGTSLAVAGAAAATGFLGKLLAGQVPLWPTTAVVAGTIGGAMVGARLSLRTPTRLLRACLVVLIGLVALRVWIDVFSH
jgi:uncharacterized membrane protein YfcA